VFLSVGLRLRFRVHQMRERMRRRSSKLQAPNF
jgi:hypothetical protein